MRYLLYFLINCLIGLPIQAIELPDIGNSAQSIMSPAEEQKLGEAFLRQLRRRMEMIDDPHITNYINELGNQLASSSDEPEQTFRFVVVKQADINAFAVPGGLIGVHSGLILATRNESELASVLAHEIAHITQHHIARTVESAQNLSLPAIAGLIAAVIAGAKNPQIGQAAVTAIMAGNVQMQINFTRTHEREADRVGMQILANAHFDPLDMPNFFERLQAAYRYYEDGIPEFLRTHPVTTERIAEARDRAEKYSPPPLTDTPFYHLMKAKLLLLVTENKVNLLKTLTEMLKTGRYQDERATRYALALTLLATQQTNGVKSHIDWLMKQDGDRVLYHLLSAQLAWIQKQDRQALQTYEQTLQIYPHDQMVSLEYAEKLLQDKAAAKAKTLLLNLAPLANPHYYRLLAQAQQMTGATAEAHLALAEDNYLLGQTQLAIEQLKLARQQKGLDFYLASRIEARYKELQAEWLEEQTHSKEKPDQEEPDQE
jgi:beta-barrel assembly-enhancing protease